MKLYTETQGQGPSLVLLHGWGFSHRVWQGLVPLLAKQYTVMTLDLPGFGHSPLDTDIHTLEKFSEAILSVIPESTTLVGWSLGGLAAQYLAFHHPARIKALIAVASTPCFIQHPNWPGMNKALLHSFADELEKNYQKILQRFLALQFFGSDVERHLIKQLSEQIIQEASNPQALQLGLELLLNSDLRSELKKISCPTRFILGKLDAIVPATLAEALPTLNPTIAINVINGAGHAPFISHPEAFLAATGLLQ